MASRTARSDRSMISSDKRLDIGEFELVEQLRETSRANLAGRDLGVDVADDFARRPNVGCDEVERRRDFRRRAEELAEWHMQAFLEHLAGVGGEPDPADIDHVAATREESDQRSAMEDRRDHAHVVELTRELVGVVGKQDVAGLDRSPAETPRGRIAFLAPWC